MRSIYGTGPRGLGLRGKNSQDQAHDVPWEGGNLGRLMHLDFMLYGLM